MFPDFENTSGLFTEVSPKGLSGLSLAFIGDAVYELFIRNYILSKGEAKVSSMHKDSVRLVNASFQAFVMDNISSSLTETEQNVYKRGRNAHAGHTPKNKSEAEYHKSTGFEALIGYTYLNKDMKRLNELFSLILVLGEKYEQK